MPARGEANHHNTVHTGNSRWEARHCQTVPGQQGCQRAILETAWNVADAPGDYMIPQNICCLGRVSGQHVFNWFESYVVRDKQRVLASRSIQLLLYSRLCNVSGAGRPRRIVLECCSCTCEVVAYTAPAGEKIPKEAADRGSNMLHPAVHFTTCHQSHAASQSVACQ